MADTRTKEQRSHIMKSVGSRDTGPELTVRRLLHRLGYRYRLHRRDLPGRPDIVFPVRRKAIFIHGCFWHGHDCEKGKLPKSRAEYWTAKIKTNQGRDARAIAGLEDAGWQTLSVWQCELKGLDTIARALREFLGPPGNRPKASPSAAVRRRSESAPRGADPHRIRRTLGQKPTLTS
jgi:DNA mismatch endonuclease (patch repair protein)